MKTMAGEDDFSTNLGSILWLWLQIWQLHRECLVLVSKGEDLYLYIQPDNGKND